MKRARKTPAAKQAKPSPSKAASNAPAALQRGSFVDDSDSDGGGAPAKPPQRRRMLGAAATGVLVTLMRVRIWHATPFFRIP